MNEKNELMYFIIHYSPGQAWLEGKPLFEQELMEHGDYMSQLVKENILLVGGPFSNEDGGLAIIKVRDEIQAKVVLENDPAIKIMCLKVL